MELTIDSKPCDLAGEPIALNEVAPPQRLYGGENILHCAARLTRLTDAELQAGAFSATTTGNAGSRWQESLPRRALVGFLLGWILIPLAVFDLLTEP